MSKYRKKPVVIEAITFDEMITHGKNDPDGHVVSNVPWSFNYNGHPITHDSNDCYMKPTLEGTRKMTLEVMLVIGVQGEIYPCKLDIFEETYEKVE